MFIENYNNIFICNSCSEFGIFMNTQIIIQDNIECVVCMENKKAIELPNCKHSICIDCFKSIYLGYITDDAIQKPVDMYDRLELEPIFPYEDDEDKLDYWNDYNFNIYEPDFNKTKEEPHLIKPRAEWMNTEIFINYEKK